MKKTYLISSLSDHMEKIDKKALRKICRENRKKLSESERNNLSEMICEKLLPYLEGKTIMSYCPYKEEVDVNKINEMYDVCLPVIHNDGNMEVYKPVDNRFILNRLGIKEPDPAYGVKVDKKDIDVIIVPLVGFDEKRNRLGQGGGYYDRFLKGCTALKIGVGFAAQKLEQIQTEDNDIALDMIITEKEVL